MKVDEGPINASDIAITITVEKDGVYEVNGVRHEPSVSVHMLTGATKLRRQLRESNELIVCPGVYDGLSARIAINLGFKAMYMVRHVVLQQSPTQWLIQHSDGSWDNGVETRNGGSRTGSAA
jgi:hypothetical protein